ncbi:16958_t:CDS:1, partial [Dentiscutata heterogama]
QTLQVAFDKLKDRYNIASLKSVSQLTSFFYNLNYDLDSMAQVKDGAHI